MKTHYTVLKTISLGFLTPRDQYDSFIDPNKGYTLIADETTIWLARPDGKVAESITTASAIQAWLEEGAIEEITPLTIDTYSAIL